MFWTFCPGTSYPPWQTARCHLLQHDRQPQDVADPADTQQRLELLTQSDLAQGAPLNMINELIQGVHDGQVTLHRQCQLGVR